MSEEKSGIEKATADAFIELYNNKTASTFRVTKYGDSPDVECIDTQGVKLQLEITLTEDRYEDIRALLSRSSKRDIDSERVRLLASRISPKHAEVPKSSIHSAAEVVVKAINKKLSKDYGPNTALVVRDTSGVNWDWDLVIDDIKDALDRGTCPYDKGIWLIQIGYEQRFFRVV